MKLLLSTSVPACFFPAEILNVKITQFPLLLLDFLLFALAPWPFKGMIEYKEL